MSVRIPEQVRFVVNRIRERLWVKPLVICLFSIMGALAARAADGTGLGKVAPEVSTETIETLLSIMASSMLVIATLAVASMVSAYASASTTATPRSFALVVADDVSQNALSTFTGAFIFSIVALTAAKNDYFGTAGRFTLFVLTVAVFALVIVTFVGWVDRIARLGRLGSTVDKVEAAAASALRRRRQAPALDGVPAAHPPQDGLPLFAPAVGYVQRIDVAALQAFATEVHGRVVVAALPGAFVAPDRPIAHLRCERRDLDVAPVLEAFTIGGDRLFDTDPQFGFVVLSEIAGRALSPAINDPGTAIDVIGTLVRLFTLWVRSTADEPHAPTHDRVEVPELAVRDLFDGAFTALARDGAGMVEVGVRLQEAFRSLASLGDVAVRDAAIHHSRMALAHSERALALPEEIAAVREAARSVAAA